MRAVRYHEYGGPDVLQVDEIDRPTPGPAEVLVDVEAASVNPVDTKFREGTFGSVALPAIPGGDGAGVVAEVGEGVAEFAAGDRVVISGLGGASRGTFAEAVAAPATKLARLPASVPFEIGAAIGNAGATAWTALVEHGEIEPGDRVLVHGGAGGVGHLAVQIAAAGGADVVATAGSEEARARVRELGARAALDYASGSLADDVLAATDGEGVDVVLDHRLDEYLELDLAVAAKGARIVTIQGDVSAAGGAPLRNKEVTLRGMSMANTPDRRPALRRLARLAGRGDLTAVVAATYDLDGAGQAHRDVLAGGYVGKLVVVL